MQRIVQFGLIGLVLGWLLVPAFVAAETAVAVAAPVSFAVKPVDDGHHLELSWQPGGDAAATTAYFVARSTDDSTMWEAVAPNVTATTYRDEAVAPGVHYYYRVAALNAAGAVSEYALADASTVDASGAAAGPSATFTSGDGVATAALPAAQVPAGARCSVVGESPQPGSKPGLVAGPYQLTCQGADGQPLPGFSVDVQWRFDVGNRLKGYVSPQVMHAAGDSNPLEAAPASQYDAAAHRLTATLPVTDRVAVTASVPNYGWLNYVVIGGLAAMIVIAVLFWPLRSAQQRSYQDYLRSKYYNL